MEKKYVCRQRLPNSFSRKLRAGGYSSGLFMVGLVNKDFFYSVLGCAVRGEPVTPVAYSLAESILNEAIEKSSRMSGW